MNIEILCIGGLKEPWLKEAEKEYTKRLKPYVKINITELNETRLPKNAGPAEEEFVKSEEGKTLLTYIEKNEDAFIYALDMRGKQLTSEEFSEQMKGHAINGRSKIIFIIGGSLGLSEKVRKKAGFVLSFSEMTYPHQMARIMLLEQLYRSQKIIRGEPYHK